MKRESILRSTPSITEAGLDVLVEWVEEATPPAPERDDFRLKATYLEYGSFANARRQFEAHLERHEELRRRWDAHAQVLEQRATALMRRRLEVMPEELHEALVAYKVHVYRGLAERSRHEARWARQGIALVDALMTASSSQLGAGDSSAHTAAAPG